MEEIIEAFIAALKNEPLVRKHLLKHTWTSGSSTVVYPITVWLESRQIVLQWGTSARRFDKFIARMVAKFPELIKAGRFDPRDGSCPAVIVFYFREEAMAA